MKTDRNMSNLEIARLLRAVAAGYQVKHERAPNSRFRIIAYQRAADAIEHLTSEAKNLWEEGNLDEVAGIGKTIAEHLDELFKIGKVKHFEELLDGLPPAMFELMQVPGVGAKRAYKLSKELGITKAHGAIKKLAAAAKHGQIRDLEGMGEQSELQILQTVSQVKNKSTRFLLPFAQTVADDVIAYMKKNPNVEKIDPLGSLRRQVATVGDVDISVASDHPREVIAHFVAYPKKTKLIEAGPHSAAILVPGGLHVDLMVQPPEAYGALFQHFTGSKEHNVALRTLMVKKGLSLSEYGIKRIDDSHSLRRPLKKNDKTELFDDEVKFYRRLGMEWVPPELREDRGEIQAALTHKLPHLVELKDIKGDMHLHSSFLQETSHDAGRDSIEKMVEVARALNYEYVAFTEHNPKQDASESKILDELKGKREKVDQLNTSREGGCETRVIKVFNSLEIDIRPNGELALPEKAFETLDFAVAAIHSSFRGSRADQTKRILVAIEHPKVKILAHPTGRLLNDREGIDADWEKIFEACLKNKVFLEINSWPARLDLPDQLVHNAVKDGLKLVISTDSHAAEQMELIRFGVSVARRGWAEASDIINTRSFEEVQKLLVA
ncbi:MAG: hypothetical protein HY376_00910 [Candidatus Blackburnbacteria bacterium]|nr:hypothetical protein [Candidatus Blackburnbacteria bacterium]